MHFLKISRQNTAQHLSSLVEAGQLAKEGSTRGAIYSYPQRGFRPKQNKKCYFVKKLKGLEEHVVFEEIARRLSLKQGLSEHAYHISSYAFTEMLNNAIDHSHSEKTSILFLLTTRQVKFTIRDYGVGIYRKVQRSFRLKTEFEALEHVFKGKQTTDPERHSGEGIFFTSRIADRFLLRSHCLTATVDNDASDTFLKEGRSIRGTMVSFQIRRHTRKSLTELFKKYTNADFQFDKNEISVSLSSSGGSGLLSRSQAKRLLSGLEKYARITFDFTGIKEVGQGFADEIFRVFRRAHPEIQLRFANASSVIEFMVQRALKA